MVIVDFLRRYRVGALTALIAFAADQAAKLWVVRTLVIGESWPQGGFFHLTHVVNTGSAFGLFGGYNLMLVVASVTGIGVLLVLYRPHQKPGLRAQLSSAPTDYEFSFDLSGGVKLSEDGNGGIEVLNEANRVVGIVAPPWAVDSNGMTVETTFKLRDGILVQTVAHQGAAYPVVADPSFSVGWAIYARWYDLADDPEETIEDAEDLLELIAAANCAGAPIAGTVLAGLFGTVVGSIHCAMVTLSVGESLDALEDIEDALPQTASDIPADCTLMIRLMYIGISPTRVELEDCGAYSGVYWRL